MRKLFSLLSFFILTPSFIFFSLVYLSFLASSQRSIMANSLFSARVTSVAYAALPNTQNVFETSASVSDGRVENIRNFFNNYGSILANYADELVASADTVGIDYRLVAAIGMEESGGCKVIPVDSHNCWGYGIYSGHVTKFNSYQEGIQTVSKALAKYYVANGLNSPQEIMRRWDPANGNKWSQGVNYFLNEL